jgi:hypothetical protein
MTGPEVYLYFMKFLLVALLFLSQKNNAQVTADTIRLNSTIVQIQKTFYGTEGKAVFINLHANETTSVEAAKEYLGNRNGLLIELQHDTTRLVNFDFEDRSIQFDPNRIF